MDASILEGVAIPVFEKVRIPSWPVSGERELELVREVLASEQWGGFHEIVGRFERMFAAFQHCAHGVSAMNGTVTIEMGLAAAGIGAGDEVIVPAVSFVSTATAVSRLGAIPVFVDIDPRTFQIDPARVAEAISPRTRAILAVHFGGPLADVDCLLSLAAARGLHLFEDAAHAEGSEWNRRRAGSFGRFGSFSFQNGKVMTAGEGGMLITNDAELAEKARAIANLGRRTDGASFYHHYTLGTNYRLSALQAAVLVAQLERLPSQNLIRSRNAALLGELLADVDGLTFQRLSPQVTACSYYLLVGRIDAARFGMTRDEFHRALAARGIPSTPFYPHPLYGNPLYQAGGCRVLPCPVTEACVQDAFWLPHRALLGDDETTRRIAAAILEIRGSRGDV